MKKRGLIEKIVTGVIVGPAKRRFRAQTERKISVLLETINSVENNFLRAQELQLKKYEHFANSVLFALVLQLDLCILLFEQASELDEPRKNLYSRQLALLLYEGFDDLPAVFGKDFRSALSILPSSESILRELGAVVKEIAALGVANSHDLKNIRHIAMAHRTHRAFEQLTHIRNLDHKSLTKIASALDQQLAVMAKILTQAMMEFGKAEVMFRQWR